MKCLQAVFGRSMTFGMTFLLLVPTFALSFETQKEMEDIFSNFYQVSLNTGESFSVNGFTLKKDVMTFKFESGAFFLADPINGEITAGYFVGDGIARMTPPVSTEKKQLKNNIESESLSVQFSEMIIIFNDDTAKKIQALPNANTNSLPFSLEKTSDHFQRQMRENFSLQQISRDVHALENDYINSRISQSPDRDFFFSQIYLGDFGWLTYYFNNQKQTEIFLGGFERLGTLWRTWSWARFHKENDYDENGRFIARLSEDRKENFNVSHYDMDVQVQNLKRVVVHAKISFSPKIEGLRGIRFDLFNNLDVAPTGYFNSWESSSLPIRVTGVLDHDGNPLPFLHKRHQLIILFPAELPAGEKTTVSILTEEDTIQQLTKESFTLLNTYPWYPQYGYNGGRATFDWEVRVPKPYTPTGSGNLVREWEEGDTNCSQWVSDIPVQFPSLIFGKFQKESAIYKNQTNGNSVLINVYAFPLVTMAVTSDFELFILGLSSPQSVQFKVPGTKMEDILEESKQILTLYEDIYGPFPYRELDIAQMGPQLTFGQAPPGLVQLWGFAFLSRAHSMVQANPTTAIFLRDLLPHEIAHQWWGNVVGWYEDQDTWLSESFAEYSAGIWVQARHGEKAFQNKLKDWRKDAFVADSSKPIALAHRTDGDTAGRDRQFLLYSKGPLIVHMLRMQVGEEKFKIAMHSLMKKYQNQNIKTEHLEHEFEQVAGYKLDWFFDQWFRETGIPQIRYRYDMRPSEDGKVLFTAWFEQDPANFKRFLGLPVTFHFPKNQVATQMVMIGEPVQKFQVKLPMEPQKVEVNADNRMLAEITAVK